jgi:hypothetical protein
MRCRRCVEEGGNALFKVLENERTWELSQGCSRFRRSLLEKGKVELEGGRIKFESGQEEEVLPYYLVNNSLRYIGGWRTIATMGSAWYCEECAMRRTPPHDGARHNYSPPFLS